MTAGWVTAAAIIAGSLIAYPVLRRYPVLLWPRDWPAAVRLRRQRRKMSVPDDRARS